MLGCLKIFSITSRIYELLKNGIVSNYNQNVMMQNEKLLFDKNEEIKNEFLMS